MNHCLIVWLDRRCVVQNDHFSIKIVGRLGVGLLVNKNHALAELCPLQLEFLINSFDAEADSLT